MTLYEGAQIRYARIQPGPLASLVTGRLHNVHRCPFYIRGFPQVHSGTASGTQKQKAHISLIPTIMLHGPAVPKGPRVICAAQCYVYVVLQMEAAGNSEV